MIPLYVKYIPWTLSAWMFVNMAAYYVPVHPFRKPAKTKGLLLFCIFSILRDRYNNDHR